MGLRAFTTAQTTQSATYTEPKLESTVAFRPPRNITAASHLRLDSDYYDNQGYAIPRAALAAMRHTDQLNTEFPNRVVKPSAQGSLRAMLNS